MKILNIPSAEEILIRRKLIEGRNMKRIADEDAFYLYNAYDEINKVHGYGKLNRGCGGCMAQKVLPMLRNWLAIWDKENKENDIELIPLDWDSYSLSQLREIFPDIKSNSKDKFIQKIIDGEA